MAGSNSPITHVFVLMLENHSFDNIFALSGIPDIRAATTSNCNSFGGKSYRVHGDAPPSMPSDPGHELQDVAQQLTGLSYPQRGPYPPINNSGFAANYATSTTEGPAPPSVDIGDIMACFNTSTQLPVSFQLAKEFALCDQWFSSMPGPTWPNRFFVHGASSAGLDHSPTLDEILDWEATSWISGFTYPHGSIYDELTTKGVQWALYQAEAGPFIGAIPQVASIHNIAFWDVHYLSEFFSGLQSNKYPYQYTFIEPNYGDITGTYEGGSSQHPMDGVAGGESLIKSVYEAVRNSGLWDSSLLIITYDEHGGFYDHYAPGTAIPPNDGSPGTYNKYGFNFDLYGVRVPAIIISPWIAAGTVDHTVYDHSSILATLEKLFGLGALTERDSSADNLLDLISSTLRTDCPKTLNSPATLLRKPILARTEQLVRDLEPVPQKGSLPGFLGVMLKTERDLSSRSPVETAAIMADFKSINIRRDARAYVASVMTRAAVMRASRTGLR
jgi:phospholipase C